MWGGAGAGADVVEGVGGGGDGVVGVAVGGHHAGAAVEVHAPGVDDEFVVVLVLDDDGEQAWCLLRHELGDSCGEVVSRGVVGDAGAGVLLGPGQGRAPDGDCVMLACAWGGGLGRWRGRWGIGRRVVRSWLVGSRLRGTARGRCRCGW